MTRTINWMTNTIHYTIDRVVNELRAHITDHNEAICDLQDSNATAHKKIEEVRKANVELLQFKGVELGGYLVQQERLIKDLMEELAATRERLASLEKYANLQYKPAETVEVKAHHVFTMPSGSVSRLGNIGGGVPVNGYPD